MQDLWVQMSHLSHASALCPKSVTASRHTPHGYFGDSVVSADGPGFVSIPAISKGMRWWYLLFSLIGIS